MVKDFLTSAKHDKLNFFAIHGDGARIKHIIEGLKVIISCVKEEVFLNGFVIDEDNAADIINASYNAKRLVFTNCTFYWKNTVNINKDAEFKIREISIYNCEGGISTFEEFIRLLESSSLKLSLKYLHIMQNDKVSNFLRGENVIRKHGIKIIEDTYTPISKDTVKDSYM